MTISEFFVKIALDTAEFKAGIDSLRSGLDAMGSTLTGAGTALTELLVHAGLCTSKGQARKDLEGGGIYVNNVRVNDAARHLTAADLLFGKHLLLRKGKRTYAVLSVS